MKISVIIPCANEDIAYLKNSIDHYIFNSDIVPDEIIVSLSGFIKGSSTYVRHMKNQKTVNLGHYFDKGGLDKMKVDKVPMVQIVTTQEQLFAGMNRHIGFKRSSGDIIIFHDADDTNNYNRIGIVKKAFELYPEMQHFQHGWVGYGEGIINLDFNYDNGTIGGNPLTNHIYKTNFHIYKGERKKFKVTNGCCAVRRNVLEIIPYDQFVGPRAQDTKFCKQVISQLNSTMYCDLPLLNYRLPI
jgi:glycosyltransferase involved in cell wall biosynthesis